MKYLVLAAHFLLLNLTVSAQDNFSEGKYTVGDRTFETNFMGNGGSDGLLVIARLPQYKEGYPWPEGPNLPLMVRRRDMKVDTVIDRKIIYEVLDNKLETLRRKGEEITISYAFGPDGNVVDISSYSLARNTIITPKELALIDKRLRTSVTASFKGSDYLNWKVILFVRELTFD